LTHYYVLRLEHVSSLRFIDAPLQELPRPKSRIFNRRLVNLQTIIVQIVGKNELSVTVFRFSISQYSIEPQRDLLIDPFKEILLGRFRNQSEDISQRIFL
jgi:hypothetical protein